MIFAFFLYIAACVTSTLWFFELRRERSHSLSTEEFQQLGQAVQPLLASGEIQVTRTAMPDGETRIEREYLDEHGHLVKEITIEKQAEPDVEVGTSAEL